MTKEIQLTKGYVALVDDDLYPLLARYKWHAHGPDKSGNVYATRYESGRQVRMHRQIMGVSDKPAHVIQVDHVNMDPLDNRRKNLRLATKAQNGQNRGATVDNSTGYKGVTYHKPNRKWMAQIRVNGKTTYLGNFEDPKEAARAYNVAAKKHHGEFARLNNIGE